MADYSLLCYDSAWWGVLALILSVVVIFSLGAPAMVAYTLYTRRKDLQKEETRELLGVLYYLYREECYW